MDSKMKFKNMQITLYLHLVCPVKREAPQQQLLTIPQLLTLVLVLVFKTQTVIHLPGSNPPPLYPSSLTITPLHLLVSIILHATIDSL